MQELREQIVELLKNYQSTKKKIALLRFEWEHPRQVTPSEMLEAMTFSQRGEDFRPSVGHVSDKTYHIAVNYQDRVAYENRKQISEISQELEKLERKLYRVEYCVAQLPQEQRAVIKGLYFESKGLKSLAVELRFSESSIQRYRDKALDALVDMYETLESAGIVLEW